MRLRSDHADTPRRRGRPPNAARRHLREQDEAIAGAVDVMTMWGLPLRDVVRKAVAQAALDLWHRSIGVDGVVAIWRRVSRASGWQYRPARYRLEWRREQQPPDAASMTPVEIAARLLINGRAWDPPQLLGAEPAPFAPRGDQDNLAPAAKAEFRLRRVKTG